MIKLPQLTLDLAKSESFNLTQLKLRQGDTGYILPFKLTENWQNISVNASNLGFRAAKSDKKIIDIYGTNFSQDPSGTWLFAIPAEFTELATPIQEAHIYVKDGDDTYTSSDFAFYIEPQFGDNSGVSAENITAINKLLESANALNAELKGLQNSLPGQITSVITNVQTEAISAISKINIDGNNAIKKVSDDGKAAIKKVSDDGTATITQINNDFTTLVQTFTQQINKFISTNQDTVNLKLGGWQKQIDVIKEQVADASKTATDLKSQVDTIQQTDVKNLTDKLNDIKNQIDNISTDAALIDLKNKLDSKADKTALDSYAKKTDLSDLSSYAKVTDLTSKADKTELSDYAKTSDLVNKADKSYVDDQIDTRVDKPTVSDLTDRVTKLESSGSGKKKAYLKVVPGSKNSHIISIRVAGYATYDDNDFDGDFMVTFSFRNSVDSRNAFCSFFIADEKGEKISDLDFSKFAQIQRIQITRVGGNSDTGLFMLDWDKVKETIEISSQFFEVSDTVWAPIPIKMSTGTFL